MSHSSISALLIPSAIGLSHSVRMILVATELMKCGAEVAFASKDSDMIQRYIELESFRTTDVFLTDFTSNIFTAYTTDLIRQCVEDELQVIQRFQPDVIIGDMRLTAAISSRLAGIPYISVVNGYMTDYFNPVDAMLSKGGLKYRTATFAGKIIQSIQKYKLATPFRTVARHYGIRDLESLYDFLRGDLTLIADLPGFCPLDNLPASFRYVGPLIWEGVNETVPDYLLDRDRSKPLIYATTGNTGQEEFIDLVVDAFGHDNAYDVVLTTGAFIDPGRVPKCTNIHVERFIPGSKVMEQCQAVIHCGGNGTTYQALAQGVPAVVVPFNNDQRINAWLVKKHKVGIPISSAGLTSQQVRRAMEELREDTEIRQNLEHFKHLVRKSDGPRAAADAIIAYLEEKSRRSQQNQPQAELNLAT